MDPFDTALGGVVAALGDQGPVLVALFAAVVLTVVGAAGLFASADPIARRLVHGAGRAVTGATPVSLRQSRAGATLRRLDSYVVPRGEEERSRMQLRLAQAGYRGADAVRNYYLVRVALGLGVPVAFSAMFPVLSRGLGFHIILISMLACGIAGFILPSFWVDARVRMRQRLIREGFPDALDMLLVCVEAGLGLDAALARVAEELGPAHPVLAEELTIVGLELRAGKPRDLVLQGMAKRIGVDEVSSFVSVLTQSSRFGTSIADALRVYAADMRLRRMMRAEEKANQLPVKMSIVLVLCTLPAMFAVILGPGVIQVIRTLFPAMAGQG